jgi:hypothetical protein
MDRLPFDPCDFFGYLASGLVVIVGMDLVVWFPHVVVRLPHVLGQELNVVVGACWLFAVDVVGQVVATPAKALLEDDVIDELLGRPSVNLFRRKPPMPWRVGFPGFNKPLSSSMRERILARVRHDGLSDPQAFTRVGVAILIRHHFTPEPHPVR